LQTGPVGLRLRLEGAYGKPGNVFRSSLGEVQDDLWGLWAHVGIQW